MRTPPPSSRRQRRALARARIWRERVNAGHFLLIVQCRQAPRPIFGARAKPSAVSGHHPGTRMSPCGGECRVGRTLLRGGPSSPAHAGTGALVRDPTGVRDTQAFLCTNLDATPMEILRWLASRSKQHSRIAARISASKLNGNGPTSLSRERRRRCSECSPSLHFGWRIPKSTSAFARDPQPGITNANLHSAVPVRRVFWSAPSFSMSRHPSGNVKIPTALMELTDALCYAA